MNEEEKRERELLFLLFSVPASLLRRWWHRECVVKWTNGIGSKLRPCSLFGLGEEFGRFIHENYNLSLSLRFTSDSLSQLAEAGVESSLWYITVRHLFGLRNTLPFGSERETLLSLRSRSPSHIFHPLLSSFKHTKLKRRRKYSWIFILHPSPLLLRFIPSASPQCTLIPSLYFLPSFPSFSSSIDCWRKRKKVLHSERWEKEREFTEKVREKLKRKWEKKLLGKKNVKSKISKSYKVTPKTYSYFSFPSFLPFFACILSSTFGDD